MIISIWCPNAQSYISREELRDVSLLTALESYGYDIKYNCRIGVCEMCNLDVCLLNSLEQAGHFNSELSCQIKILEYAEIRVAGVERQPKFITAPVVANARGSECH